MPPRSRVLLLGLLATAACGNGMTDPPSAFDLALEPVATGLSSPVLVTAPLNDPARLFVVEQGGIIKVIRNGQLLSTPFLDLRSRVSTGGERGLLGLAFHPNYATNGILVVNYTNLVGDTRVSSFKVTSNPDVADPGSEKVILAIQQPYPNHNGGQVIFGPFGYLWVGMGDGGSAGDPGGRAQDPQNLLGKMIRMTVEDDGTGSVPAGNPFVGQFGIRWEIWSLGVRNPWRYSFDRVTNDFYLADVGQNTEEEINVSSGLAGSGRARNYGWRLMEGSRCFNPSSNCTEGVFNLTLPLVVYGRSEGCSVIGGHVYRGPTLTEIEGVYLYSDYCGGWVRSFRYQNGQATDQREWPALKITSPTSFGEDAAGELYLVSGQGTVYRIIRRN
ncbi:MAG: PQQ-dependent sugar dehydrogenase [Gemmatimonadota bacterium]